ncbi:hypothetical protein Patl1_31979 [Pistacia atlantica]|uniref:Uncharacterized protein n=1 Tax=Pistacia atlantica TaxID=434234 RepID=A0ACC1AMM1_9ROSI|nr:hypothetical protein Patl1_31979 [Pistacia atlantica]
MVRVPRVPERVTIDDESISNDSSRYRPVTLRLKKDGNPSLVKRMKHVESNVSAMEKVSSQCHSSKLGHKIILHRSGGSLLDPSHQGRVVQGKKFGVSYHAGTHRKRGKVGVQLLACEEAALALMKLANDSWGSPYSNRGHRSANWMTGGVMIDQLNDKIPYGKYPQVAGCKARRFERFQQPKVEDMEEDNGSLRKKKRKLGNSFSLLQSKYMNDDVGEQGKSNETYKMLEGAELINKLQNKDKQPVEACQRNACNTVGNSLLGSGRVPKKQRKKKADVSYMGWVVKSDRCHFKSRGVINESPICALKKQGFKKEKTDAGSSASLIPDSFFSESGAKVCAAPETKPLKKLELSPMSSTFHKGFSFSIIHFLSAIRTAMVTLDAEDDTIAFSKHLEKDNRNIGQTGKNNLPSLTINEIVERVRTSPGDPCILEAREPLEDLVRGALEIFSSKLGPPGAKGWQALALYSKSRKSWSWIGPVSFNPNEAIKEKASAESWGIRCRTLLKLVDSFSNWLRSFYQTLQQIGSLPAPPAISMQRTPNLEERLRVVRPRKCIATISPCSKEVRAYFQKEEALRYSVPERAFSYTALDGRKSTVAPLRRSSGKPSSKVRGHYMLRDDRPPHVTVLCLVRDAAARLPARMGTRADVCILVRDSQYMVEGISDEQLNQVVSHGLDRLHYETDPCVQFNGVTKLWVYLHGEREEDDFSADGTDFLQTDSNHLDVGQHFGNDFVCSNSTAGLSNVFDEMLDYDVENSNSIITHRDLHKESVLSNAVSLCGSARDIHGGAQYHCLAIRSGYVANVYVGSSLISLYSKCGEMVGAYKVFQELPVRNVVSWTAIIAAFAQEWQIEMYCLVDHMKSLGYEPEMQQEVVDAAP